MKSEPISEDVLSVSTQWGSSKGVEEWRCPYRLGPGFTNDNVYRNLNTKAPATCAIGKSLSIDVVLRDSTESSG